MRSLYLWLLICFAALLFVPEVARGATPYDAAAVVKAEDVEVAGLFRRIFDGGRCGPGGCPKPDAEPDVPDDPPPVKVEPIEPIEPEPVEVETNLPTGLFIALAIAGGFVTLLLIIKKERG